MGRETEDDRIDAEPTRLALEICRTVERSIPARTQVQALSRELLRRHAVCRLKPVVSSEETLEGYYRCVITEAVAKRYMLSQAAIPSCVNSSHRAVRRVCAFSGRHNHADIEDAGWRKGWDLIQQRRPEVNVRVGGAAAKRADLYVVTGKRVVSVEFKYIGPGGLRDIEACAAQVRRHAEWHAEAILVLYAGGGRPVSDPVVRQLGLLMDAQNVRVANLVGPEIPVARDTA